jgi:hypothetical protein
MGIQDPCAVDATGRFSFAGFYSRFGISMVCQSAIASIDLGVARSGYAGGRKGNAEAKGRRDDGRSCE